MITERNVAWEAATHTHILAELAGPYAGFLEPIRLLWNLGRVSIRLASQHWRLLCNGPGMAF